MTPTLRDALAAARINRLKARIARAWAQRQREAEAEAGDHPVCPGCGKRHPPNGGLAGLLRVLGGADEDEATPQPAPSSLN